ncbi:hypothetical protein M404DRAFT_994168 [Pisolithus tinctorius Marx 270]|uniref:Uncharacterized protein n=1 Tax=Pisolithus tinctorius Marx 270 TaxID=870435 RepID=A0A0C3PSR7_PISTI|nr:hypothetical protein M404DRAFT_994168 [Pisolithus tinctorius Marx 270]
MRHTALHLVHILKAYLNSYSTQDSPRLVTLRSSPVSQRSPLIWKQPIQGATQACLDSLQDNLINSTSPALHISKRE